MDDSISSSKAFHQTAMSIFSRISPKRKSPYLQPEENDDFLHNYLYCSKTPEGIETNKLDSGRNRLQTMCELVNAQICCANLFPSTSASGPVLSLSGDNNNNNNSSSNNNNICSNMEPETWFDLDQFEFLEHLAGRGRQKSNPWNVSFQAPTLRKGDSARKLQVDSIVEEGEVETDGDPPADNETEEKKSDENKYSRSPKGHARHFSYFPSRQGPQFALSDSNQFEMIYGVAPETLADSLTRDLEAYQHRDGHQVVVGSIGNKDKVEVNVAAFLAGASKLLLPEKRKEVEDEFESLVSTQTF
jgi:hypothetical protein